MDRQATIKTLKRLAMLISDREELDSLISYGIDDQTSKTLTSINNKFFGWKDIPCPSLASCSLDIIKPNDKKSPVSYGAYVYCTLGVALAAIAFLPQIIGWTGYFIVLMISVVLLGVLIFCKRMQNKANKKGIEQAEYEPVQRALSLYEQQVQQGVQQLAERRMLYSKAFTECLQEIEAAEKRKVEVRVQINDYNKEIAAIDLITPRHYHLIDSIINLLEAGRADNYKEALNMAVDQEAQRKHQQALENTKQRELEYAAEQKRLALMQCERCCRSSICKYKGMLHCASFEKMF